MAEPVLREQRAVVGGENEQEGQEAGTSMQPPVFQLQAAPEAPLDNDGAFAAPGGPEAEQEVAAPIEAAAEQEAEAEQEAAAGGPPAEWLDHLRLREGDESSVYLDSVGLPTVGVGHLLSVEENEEFEVGTEIPQATRDAWLEEDATDAYDAATDQAATLGITDDAFISALASVNFQLGTGWNTEHTNTWDLMVAGDYDAAATEAADSTWNTQTPVRVTDFQDALRALDTTEEVEGATTETVDTTVAPETETPAH